MAITGDYRDFVTYDFPDDGLDSDGQMEAKIVKEVPPLPVERMNSVDQPDTGLHNPVPDAPEDVEERVTVADQPVDLGRPRRSARPPARFDEYLMYDPENDDIETFSAVCGDSPISYDQCMSSSDASSWKEAMKNEVDALNENDTWKLVSMPKDRKVVGGKWVYKIKRDSKGQIEKYKARYVAQGFSQIPGLEYKETYAPTARPETIRLIFALTAQFDCVLDQMDVKSAYLHSAIEEELYLQQPRGFEQVGENGSKLVCKLQKSIYGLKQAAYNWNKNINSFLMSLGFERSKSDSCLYIRRVDGDFEYIVIWVDDIVICGSSRDRVDNIKAKVLIKF